MEPKKHHYIPRFYLSRWAADDGRLVEFSKPYKGIVKPKRVHPAGTGYEDNLYGFAWSSGSQPQALEKVFFGPVDTKAAEALAMIEAGISEHEWAPPYRSAWTRFILSLLLRTPEDLATLKAEVKSDWLKELPGLDEKYAAAKGPTDPPTLAEYLEMQQPEFYARSAYRILPGLIDHYGIGSVINGYTWRLLTFSDAAPELLTSDRPLWMTPTILEQNAFLIMPIGPKRAFAASLNPHIQYNDEVSLARTLNLFSASYARKYVYARSDAALNFVVENMGTKQWPSLIERLIQYRRNHSK